MRYKSMYPMILVYILALVLAGLIFDDPANILPGLQKIVLTQDVLITDYVEIAGPGAAFVNSALVTLISLGLLYLSGDPLNGFTITEMGLMSGFALFGKNVANIWPIILGTWVYARIQKEPFSKYTSVALLATALSPLVSYMGLGSLYAHPLGGVLTGMLIGMVLGYNLRFGAAVALMCLAFIVCGLFCSGHPVWANWAGYRRLLTSSGRAPSDFLRMVGGGPVLINMGVNGLLATGYILLVGGDLNGPTLGGILTVIGFSAYGKHARNILPVMCGVLLGGIFMHYNVDAPGLQLAALFGTTLAPFAGVFGWPVGILAGFLHSAVVLQAGYVLAGVNLYNNGFSGGLIAIVLFPTVTAIVRHRKPELTPRNLFDVFEGDKPEPMERDLPPTQQTPEGRPFPVLQKDEEPEEK